MNATLQTPGQSTAESAFRLLLRTVGLLRQVMEPYFARFGISGSQWGVLRVLERARAHGDGGLRLADVGERLLIRPPSVTGVVDRLERQGLVRRCESPDDLRVRLVELTPAGEQLLATVAAGHPQRVESMFAALPPQDLRGLFVLLQRLERHLVVLAHREAAPAPAEPASLET